MSDYHRFHQAHGGHSHPQPGVCFLCCSDMNYLQRFHAAHREIVLTDETSCPLCFFIAATRAPGDCDDLNSALNQISNAKEDMASKEHGDAAALHGDTDAITVVGGKEDKDDNKQIGASKAVEHKGDQPKA